MTSEFSWQNSAFVLLHFVLQGKICLLIQAFLDFLLFHSNPYKTVIQYFYRYTSFKVIKKPMAVPSYALHYILIVYIFYTW